MPCPVAFISSAGVKDRKIREWNRGPKSQTPFFSDSVWMCLHTRGFSNTPQREQRGRNPRYFVFTGSLGQ